MAALIRRVFIWPLLLTLLLALGGCGIAPLGERATPATDAASHVAGAAPSEKTLTLASKNFTEAFILGEMYALLLEEAGFTVKRKPGLGATEVVHAALLTGEVDLYPEYTSTGLLTVLGEPAMQDRQAIFDKVKAEYEAQFGLTWLDTAPFNNTQALAVTAETSQRLGLTRISQLRELAPQLRLGGPPEFFERPDGLPGLTSRYGEMAFAGEVAVDPGLRYDSLLNNGVDVVVAFGTDGQIGGYDLVILEDDAGLWPPYQAAPVVRLALLNEQPTIASVLNPLAPLLTDAVMADLNWMVDGPAKQPYEEVARQFLQEQGLLP